MKSLSKMFLIIIVLSHFVFGQDGEVQKYDATPPIVPYWAFHPWVWEDSLNTQEVSLNLVNSYKSRNIPVGTIMIDSPWSMSYNDYIWNRKQYPAPHKMVDSLHNMNVKVIVWITGAMNITGKDVPVQKTPAYDFVKENGFAINGGNNSMWWKGEGVHIDNTNPKATKWWRGELDKVFADYNLDGVKADDSPYAFGENVRTSIGLLSNEEFSISYYHDISKYVKSRNKNGVMLSRGYSHQTGAASNVEDVTVSWSGDCSGSWRGLRLQIQDIYKSARIGYGALACEIGGYNKKRSNMNEFTRYAQFGSMCPVMINGGANGALTNHLPWFHGKDTENIYRYFATLHNELAPYIFSNSVESHIKGGSIVKNTSFKNESHTLGNDIFVKAITSSNNKVTVLLPNTGNEWIDYWTDKEYKSGAVVTQNYPLDKYPMFIRAGAIIPMNVKNNVTGHGDENSVNKQTILIYPNDKSEYTFHKPVGEGTEYRDVEIEVDSDDGEIEIKISSDKKDDYLLLVKADKKPNNVIDADSWEYDSDKNIIEIMKKGKSFTLEIKY